MRAKKTVQLNQNSLLLRFWFLSWLVAAGFLWLAEPSFRGRKQIYTDITLGDITWLDLNKNYDFAILRVIILGFLVAFVGSAMLVYSARRLGLLPRAQASLKVPANESRNLLWSIGVVMLVVWICNGPIPWAAALLVGFAYLVYRKDRCTLREVFLLAMLWILVQADVLALTTLVSFSSSYAQSYTAWLSYLNLLPLISALALGLAFLFWNDRALHFSLRMARALQVPLPLLLLQMIKARSRSPDIVIYKDIASHTVWLVSALVVSLVAWQCLWLWRNRRSWAELPERQPCGSERFWRTIVSPVSVVALGMFAVFQVPSAILHEDDLHMGEMLTPWQQWADFGQRLYRDFVPVQNHLAWLEGAINHFCLADSAGSFQWAHPWMTALTAGISTATAVSVLGSFAAFFFALLSLVWLDRFFLLPTLILLMIHPRLIRRPLLWLTIWPWCCLAGLAFNSSSGAAFVLGSTPVALFQLYEFLRSLRRGGGQSDKTFWLGLKQFVIRQKLPLASITLWLVFFFATQSFWMHMLQFILDNQASYTVAHGRLGMSELAPPPILASLLKIAPLRNWLWQFYRLLGWFFAVTIFVYIIAALLSWGRVKGLRDKQLLFLCVIGAVSALALTPWSMGRIGDPGGMSRSGGTGIFFLGVLLPMAAFFARRFFAERGWLWLCSALGVGFFISFHSPFLAWNWPAMLAAAQGDIVVPAEARLIDGAQLKLPRLGQIWLSSERHHELQSLHGTLNKYLAPEESYYDFTNRSTWYYLLGRKVPALYPAPFVLASERLQTKVISRLSQQPPPLVWLSATPPAPSGALRSYRVYRWFIEQNYQAVREGDSIWMMPDSRWFAAGFSDLAQSESLLVESLGIFDLQQLPSAWGRNFDGMSWRFRPGIADQNVELTKAPCWGSPRVLTETVAECLELDLVRQRPYADFVLLSFDGQSLPAGGLWAQIFWRGDQRHQAEGRGFRFKVSERQQLVPLGANPSWLRGGQKIRLQVQLFSDPEAPKTKLLRAQFFRLQN